MSGNLMSDKLWFIVTKRLGVEQSKGNQLEITTN